MRSEVRPCPAAELVAPAAIPRSSPPGRRFARLDLPEASERRATRPAGHPSIELLLRVGPPPADRAIARSGSGPIRARSSAFERSGPHQRSGPRNGPNHRSTSCGRCTSIGPKSPSQMRTASRLTANLIDVRHLTGATLSNFFCNLFASPVDMSPGCRGIAIWWPPEANA